ncbi:MAG: hypothetical protein JWO20_3020 [Candidatus Angelobacter sp.]|nr:hypothetical protein [Candidatus Angelobacter sp.]
MFPRKSVVFAVLIVAFAAVAPVVAKDKPLTGIILFQSESGPAYAQVTDLLLNGKLEVYVCQGTESLDNNTYKKLPKASLAQATALERESSGVLTMSTGSGSSCALPVNLKLEKNKSYALKDVAEMAVVQFRLLSKSSNAPDLPPQQMKPGTRIQFVAAPDVELAEYLRASRAQTIPLWTDYLKQYGSSSHGAEARTGLATLITAEAETELSFYYKAVAEKSPNYDRLTRAKARAAEARRVLPSFAKADAVISEVDRQVQTIIDAGKKELAAYQKSLTDHTTGYAHLNAAKVQLDHARTADPDLPSLAKADSELNSQTQEVERAMASADSLIAAKKFDEAYAAIAKFTQFAPELPRVESAIGAAFKNRRDQGDEFVKTSKLAEAISEYKKALEYRKDADTQAALNKAVSDLQLFNNKEAAQQAMAASQEFAQKKQFVEAYEKLSGLPEVQRQYVSADMEALQKDYVTDLVSRADALTRVHIPIRGRADEDAARQAHEYLLKAAQLDAGEAIRIKLDLASDAVSDYYLKQAQRLLDKPRGVGIGLGWLLVKEGQRYKSDLEGLKDQLTKYTPDYDTKAKLSIAIYFRDQTSRRDSLGFADQLADTVASGLEGSGLPGVKTVTRKDRNAVEADVSSGATLSNLQLVGDIIRHQVDKKMDTQRLTSHYRAGHREIKNPTWIEANRNVESAQREYEKAKDAYNASLPKMKKNAAAAGAAALATQSSEIDALKEKLSKIPETLLENITEPYNYTRRSMQYTASVEVALRLVDPAVESAKLSDSIKVDVPKTIVLLENVKPEDTDGIVGEGDPLDEIQLLADAESQAKAVMVKKLIEWVHDAPPKILQEARSRSSNSDLEAAAERYIVYLNSTGMKSTPERAEAQQYLKMNFNVSTIKLEP